MLEALGSLEFSKSSQMCLKAYPSKAHTEITCPFCKAKDFSKAWLAHTIRVILSQKPQGFQVVLFRISLWSHSQRSRKLLDHNRIFLQEGSVEEKSVNSSLHRV